MTQIENFFDQVETNEIEDATSYLEINVNYNDKQAQIMVGYKLGPVLSEILILRSFIVTIGSSDNQSTENIFISNYLVHICSNNNKCHYKAMYDHIKWLVEANYMDLAITILPFISFDTHDTGMLSFHFLLQNRIYII